MRTFRATSESLRRLDEILAHPARRRVGVLGLGVVGRGMVEYLVRSEAIVTAADRRVDAEALLAADVRNSPLLTLQCGETHERTFADCEAVAISPGADPRQAAIEATVARGAPVFGELELAGRLPAPSISVTGTNGKSTTTALAGAMLPGRVFVGGNLGAPLLAWAKSEERWDWGVVELSSFQLETAFRYRTEVAVVLNVTPDHGERYDTFEDYVAAKRVLLANLGDDDIAILNRDDEVVRRMARGIRARCVWFSTRGPASGVDAWLEGDHLQARGSFARLDGLSLVHDALLGRHNRENAMAAWLAVHALLGNGLDLSATSERYRAFRGLEHRYEVLGAVAGVTFINDSKATNVDAAVTAVRASVGPTIVLVGGVDKGAGYAELASECAERDSRVIAYGASGALIEDACRQGGMSGARVERVDGFFEAFRRAAATARPGDTVLLAPACSSFDEFDNYRARGDAFRAAVRQLEEDSHG